MKELLVPYGTIELAELARRSSGRDLSGYTDTYARDTDTAGSS